MFNSTKTASFELVFDPTLVRGMSYYTGTNFEIAIPEFGGSCGGGGRYDKMVGNFTGKDVPACGFSIGFRAYYPAFDGKSICGIPEQPKKVAYLIEKGYPEKNWRMSVGRAQAARAEGQLVVPDEQE